MNEKLISSSSIPEFKKQIRPISIDNLPLQGNIEQSLRKGIEENRDYVLIPYEAWKIIVEWSVGSYHHIKTINFLFVIIFNAKGILEDQFFNDKLF